MSVLITGTVMCSAIACATLRINHHVMDAVNLRIGQGSWPDIWSLQHASLARHMAVTGCHILGCGASTLTLLHDSDAQ